MIRLYILILLYFTAFASTAAQTKHKLTLDDGTLVIWETKEGRFHGKYICYYKNGTKCLKGNFENNCKVGKWTVWSRSGKVLVKRNYKNLFRFEQTKPKLPKNKVIDSLYNLTYNKQNFIEYSFVKSNAVAFDDYVWRNIAIANNPSIFEQNRLFDLLSNKIQSKELATYIDDNFEDKTTTKIDPSKFELMSFAIKEVFFFDTDRLTTESTILGLAPVVLDKESGNTLLLYWVYYPEIRAALAQEKLTDENLPTKIKTLDDLFFYRHFSSQIEMSLDEKGLTERKRLHLFLLKYKDYNEGAAFMRKYSLIYKPKEEAIKVELTQVLKEVNLWIKLSYSE